MWFIEHENLSGGKREWMKPGSQRLYGRTTKASDKDVQAGGKQVSIDNKTISRKHMMLKVLEVPPGDGTKLHSRSHLEITDFSCRQGTTISGSNIDGERMLKSIKEPDGTVRNDTMILTGTEYIIRLSASYLPFKVTWQPIVLTYATKENIKNKECSAQLHAFDIKTSIDFVHGQTTHVVTEKRNMPKVLNGLLAGSHIVTGDYLDAILKAAISPNDEPGAYSPSRLEEDFSAWWPKEREYIPPTGQEPVARNSQLLEPDPARSDMFKELIFVFLSSAQHSSLHDVIAGGSGKALLFNLELGKTTVDEYVNFVRNTAGEKRPSKATSGRSPIVTVRLYKIPDGMEQWEAMFRTSVDQKLNQRSIVQNEFLDAIITNDPAALQKPPTEIIDSTASMSSSRAESPVHEPTSISRPSPPKQVPEAAAAPAEDPVQLNPRKRPLRRGLATSRFTGFDDYEPPTKTRKIEETQTPTRMEDIQESVPVLDSYAVSQSQSQSQSQPATQGLRRREPSVGDSVEAVNQMNELFPAAAAVRSHRAATHAASASVEPETQMTARKKQSEAAEVLEKLQKAKKKAANKEIDVKEKLQTRVKQEEEKRRADEENLREQLEDVDISDIRGLVQVEDMEIIQRTDRPIQYRATSGEGWNDEWNGRKNFKKFRRRGVERGPHAPKVIVPFEEAPQKKGFGAGDAFLLEESQPSIRSDKSKKKEKKGRLGEDSDSEQEPGFVRRKQSTQTEVINVSDSDDGEDPFAKGSATSQISKGTDDRVAETQIRDTQTQTQMQRGAKKRGPPVSVAADQPASKRSRRRNDSSDDEDTGFRFKRRA